MRCWLAALLITLLVAVPTAAVAWHGADNPKPLPVDQKLLGDIAFEKPHQLRALSLGERVNLTGEVIAQLRGIVVLDVGGELKYVVLARMWGMRLPDNTTFPLPAQSVAEALVGHEATIAAREILRDGNVIGYLGLAAQTGSFSTRMLRHGPLIWTPPARGHPRRGEVVNITGRVARMIGGRIVIVNESGLRKIVVFAGHWGMRLPDNTTFRVPFYSVAFALRKHDATIRAVEILNSNGRVIGYFALGVLTDSFGARILRR